MQNLSVLSWNIQGKVNLTGHTLFKKVKPHLINLSSDIIALQEMCNAEKILKNIEALETYNIFIPELNKRRHGGTQGFNHNVLLSKYPIISAEEIIFPSFNEKIHLENGIRADVQLGDQIIRIYNCHFAIFKSGIDTRLKQLAYILEDARSYKGPTIICGDMNVAIPKKGLRRKIVTGWHREPKREMSINGKFIDYDEREIFNKTISKHGFKEVLDLYTPTWSPLKSKRLELFKLKLDWFMVKNLKVTDIKLGDYVSDHKSVEVRCHI